MVLILDGLGDLPVPALGGRTPLEAADTPVLNRLAGIGSYGLVDPVGPGTIPNTHSGCGILMGILPADVHRLKRGPVEASGAGRNLTTEEIALRANFATLDRQAGGLRILDRRAGRISSGTDELAARLRQVDLGDGVHGELLPTDQHRCVVVLSGPGLDPAVTDTDPGDRGMPAFFKSCRPEAAGAELTARKLDLFLEIARDELAAHAVNLERQANGLMPANGVITRGAGRGFSLENVLDENGLSAAVVAGCNTVIGLTRTLGFECCTDPRFTADAKTDIDAKLSAALHALERHDLAYVHIKAPDLFAHDHQPERKKVFLERTDQALEAVVRSGAMIMLAADHSTDSNTGAHTADPVPVLLFDPESPAPDDSQPVNFGEAACAGGNMPRQSSHQLLLRLMSLMGKPAAR
ncbi:MAG: phosphoglycerate mutase [Gammaproteobacteria bacterium]|nr:phosphoglycerate mutase [Gammaproteobacteria bacterium]